MDESIKQSVFNDDALRQMVQETLQKQGIAHLAWSTKQQMVRWHHLPSNTIDTLVGTIGIRNILRLQGAQEHMHAWMLSKNPPHPRRILEYIDAVGLPEVQKYVSLEDVFKQQIEHFVEEQDRENEYRWSTHDHFFANEEIMHDHPELLRLYLTVTHPKTAAVAMVRLAVGEHTALMFDSLERPWAQMFPKHALAYKKELLEALQNPNSLIQYGMKMCSGMNVPLPNDPEIRQALIQWFDNPKQKIETSVRTVTQYANITEKRIEYSFCRPACQKSEFSASSVPGHQILPWFVKDQYWLANHPALRKNVWSELLRHTGNARNLKRLMKWLCSDAITTYNWDDDDWKFLRYIPADAPHEMWMGILSELENTSLSDYPNRDPQIMRELILSEVHLWAVWYECIVPDPDTTISINEQQNFIQRYGKYVVFDDTVIDAYSKVLDMREQLYITLTSLLFPEVPSSKIMQSMPGVLAVMDSIYARETSQKSKMRCHGYEYEQAITSIKSLLHSVLTMEPQTEELAFTSD